MSQGRAPWLMSRVAHAHARICCAAREQGRRSGKEPEGGCRGERCAQDQQEIGDPGRLGRCGGGSSSTIGVIDLGRVDHLHRICHRICLGSFRGVYACRRWRGPWRTGAGALGTWESRPSRRRSRHRTFVAALVVERLVRRRRRHHRGRSVCRSLRDGTGRLLLRGGFAHLRAGGGAWRLPFALRLCLLIRARCVARFLLRLRRRRGLSRRIGGLLWPPYRAQVPLVIARLRTTHQPPLSRLPKCVESACILLSPRGGWTYITSRHNGAALAQMGHCSLDPGAEMLTVPRIKALPTADSCLRR